MKKYILFIFLICLALDANTQLNMTLQSNSSHTQALNDIWGYVADGREYSLVGHRTGVDVIDITDPTAPVPKGTATGPTSVWRDIKTFGDYAYVINEQSSGLLIINLGGLPSAITASDWTYWEPNIVDLGGILSTCHNIYIDDNGYGYLAGCNRNSGGVIYIDLFTTPGTPIYVDKGAARYAHDVFVQEDIMYTSDIYAGEFSIYDISDKSNSIFLGSSSTPDNFTHNAWANSTGDYLFTTDERSNASVAAYDISNPSNIEFLDAFKPLSTLNTGVVPHNVHFLDDYLIISHYSDGVIIVDATDPSNLVEVGNYDTCSGNCSGAWGAYPYLPSGNILVSDQGQGSFVLAPTYVRAARIEGNITDANTGDDIIGANIEIVATQANATTSGLTGNYKTGIATAGTYDVTISKTDYISKTITTTLVNGTSEILDVQLQSVLLDITLLSFDLEKKNDGEIALKWEALSDDSYIQFEIERSTDGVRFNKIGEVVDNNPSLVSKVYDFSDKNAPKALVYYRLKMIEPSGWTSYSDVKSYDNSSDVRSITIFPNPVLHGEELKIGINGLVGKDLTLEIYSISGKAIEHSKLGTEDQLYKFDPAKLTPGVYYVNVLENQSILHSERIVVLK